MPASPEKELGEGGGKGHPLLEGAEFTYLL